MLLSVSNIFVSLAFMLTGILAIKLRMNSFSIQPVSFFQKMALAHKLTLLPLCLLHQDLYESKTFSRCSSQRTSVLLDPFRMSLWCLTSPDIQFTVSVSAATSLKKTNKQVLFAEEEEFLALAKLQHRFFSTWFVSSCSRIAPLLSSARRKRQEIFSLRTVFKDGLPVNREHVGILPSWLGINQKGRGMAPASRDGLREPD